MSYITLKIMYTRGDRATQPGGLILRRCEDTGKLVTHRFNRDLNSTKPREFYWGHYFDPSNPGYEARAHADYQSRYETCQPFEIAEADIPEETIDA